MAETSLKIKAARAPKFGVRSYTRYSRCGRPRSMYREFGLRRTYLCEFAPCDELPGITKGGW